MDEIPWALYLSALGTGLVFGYVMQRGGFCLTRAISNVALTGDATMLRAYVLALLVAMVGAQIGVGMILSGGCSGSTWYRVGEGAIGAWVVLLGFAIGATTVGVGALDPLRRALQGPTLTTGSGAPPTLANVLGVSPWIVIAALAVAAGAWMARAAGEPPHA